MILFFINGYLLLRPCPVNFYHIANRNSGRKYRLHAQPKVNVNFSLMQIVLIW